MRRRLIVTALVSTSAFAQTLQTQLNALTTGFNGRVGICVQSDSRVTCVNGDQRFALQSVMKLLVGLAVMDAVDRHGWKLGDAVVVHRSDLSLYVEPIAKLVRAGGYRTTVGDLVRRAIVDSDSAAVDILVAKLGAPAAVQAVLTRMALTGVRFDRDEKRLQTEIVGLGWRPEFVDPAVLDRAIARVPEAVRDRRYREYQADPRDTATPVGMASLLYRLAHGDLLSVASTKYLLDVMTQTVTFPDRLKAGVRKGWEIAHKTGTSGSWKGVTAATNDVGILTAPSGRKLAIVAFIGDSKEPAAKSAALMAHAAALACH